MRRVNMSQLKFWLTIPLYSKEGFQWHKHQFMNYSNWAYLNFHAIVWIFFIQNFFVTGSKMAPETQMQTAWVPWIRELAETLETCLAEEKHQGELNQGSTLNPQAVEGFFTPWYTERTGGLPTPCHHCPSTRPPATELPPTHPAALWPQAPNVLGRLSPD
jgi:hypothetical protein